MTAEIISVGTELLLGDILNTNAQYLATQLAGLGFTVHYQSVVGDNPARLRNFLQMAKERSDVLLLTGGLGPTSDDITKETAAIVYGDILVMDHEELAELEAFFKKRGREMTENNKKQAMVPKNGRKLPNPNGTAPGAYFRSGSKHAFLMPGPPSEMVPMFENQVLPALRLMQDSSLRSLTLRLCGIGESDLENKTYQLLINDNPTAALYAKTGEVHIRITAKAHTADQAEVMCSEYAAMFYSLVGEYIYSDNGDDLETSVVKRLIENEESVATAESCTGGMLSSRITSVPGSSAVFGYGACTYANEIKHSALGVANRTLRRYGAVSGQVAAEMAFGAMKKGNADYGVGITGIAGPGGGSAQKAVGLVYIAVATGSRVYVRKLNLGGRSRDYIRQLACQNALDMLRRLCSGMEIPEVREFSKSVEADYERAGKPAKKINRILRPIIAVLLTAAVLFGIMFAFNRLSSSGENDKPAQGPLAQGLQYGTPEYSAAALTYVGLLNGENPSVSGLLAFSGLPLEQPVERVTGGQDELNAALARPDRENIAAISAQAAPGDSSADVLISGGKAFRPLDALLDTDNIAAVDKFSYFTQFDEKVYSIIAVFQLDEADDYNDGFKAFFSDKLTENEFLEFYLGLKARSIYDIDFPLGSKDSLMTICVADEAVKGRFLYICGKLVKDGDGSEKKTVSISGQPLLPMAEYEKAGREKPDTEKLYSYWLRRYLASGIDPEVLQIENGMPEKDLAPFLLPEPPDEESSEEQGDTNSIGLDSSEEEEASGSLSSEDLSSQSSSSSAESAGSSGESSSSKSGSDSEGDGSSGSESSSSSGVVFPAPKPSASPAPEKEKPDPAYLTVTMNGELLTAPAYEVIAYVCQLQGAGLEPEAVKALAVCVHSWILNQQGSGNEAPELLGALPGDRILELVKEVESSIICPEGQKDVPAFTPWHKMSAKGTNNAEGIWEKSRPYLGRVSANDEQVRSDWRETIRVNEENLKQAALTLFGEIDESLPKNKWVSAVVQDESGYVQSLELFGQQCSGSQLWLKLLDENGSKLLNSPAFEVNYSGDYFNFTCYGKGHGCGLSITGADMKARSGWTYDRILALYFLETELGTW